MSVGGGSCWQGLAHKPVKSRTASVHWSSSIFSTTSPALFPAKMESNPQEEELSPEFLKLKESIECFAQTHNVIASINTKLGKLNEETLEVVVRELSSGSLRDSSSNDYISLSHEEHRNFKTCLENLALMRPKLVEYNTAIKYCASIDADSVFKLLNKKLEEIQTERDNLEKRLSNAFKEIEDLETKILNREGEAK